MRKTFKLFCVAALSLLAVSSCGKIWDEFDNVQGQIDELKTKVEALEKKLNDEVTAINSKISGLEAAYKAADAELLASITTLTANLDALDGKVDGFIETDAAGILAAIEELKATDEKLAEVDSELLAALTNVNVTNVKKTEDGNVKITFTDGTTLEVPTHPEEGLVTVVEVEDVKYWAVIVDGEPVSLDVPVGHLDLKFKVRTNDNALQYSVDGGTTWKNTGAYVSTSSYDLLTEFYIGGEFNYDTFEYVENDYVTVVFGGEEYYLPVYKADNATISLKAGKTYFKYGETKEVALNVSGMADFYVMSKPDAWKAKIEGKKLVVTAPTEAVVDLGVADLDGEVLLHATSEEGKCKIVKLAVSTNEGVTVAVDAVGNITITNPLLTQSRRYDPLDGWVMTYGFAPLTVGLADVQEFSADPQGYVNSCAMGENYEAIYSPDFDNFRNGYYVMGEDGKYTDDLKYPTTEYDPTTYPVDVCTFAMGDFYRYFAYSDMPKGQHYVVWAAPIDENGEVVLEDLVYVYYEPVLVDVKLVEKSFSEITVNIEVSGAEKFFAGFVAESDFAGYGLTFDEYMSMQEGPFGAFVNVGKLGDMYKEYAEAYMGLALENGTSEEYSVSSLNYEGVGDILAPGTKYYVWAMPVVAGLSYGEYDYETNFKPYVFEFETDPLTYSADAAASVDVDYTVTPKTITATIDSDDAVMAYYLLLEDGIYEDWYSGDMYDINEMTDQEIAELLIANGTPRTEFPIEIYEQGLDPESTHALVVLAIDEDGCYGDPEVVTIETAAIAYATDYSVKFESFDATTGTATFTVTGNAQKVACYRAYYDTYTTNFVNWMLDYGLEYYAFKIADVVDGTATVTGLTGSNPWLIYSGYAADADGAYTFTEPKVVKVVE